MKVLPKMHTFNSALCAVVGSTQ